jgi:putative endonuclease
MQPSYVYIVTNKPNGTLYIGVTSDLERRCFQHRKGLLPGFTKRYNCKKLVWFETHSDMREAITREKRLKKWNRAWKIKLITAMNPNWRDLALPF